MDDGQESKSFEDGSGVASGAPPAMPRASEERAGDAVGPYTLLSVLGEGGFGIVWLAERRHPMVQRVALKIIKPGMDSRAIIARFEQERQALAVMDHPSIAKIFDAGTTALGRPYFVMEFVSGEPITDYCDRHRMTIQQRLDLLTPVCEAVQHAHMKGIIHRDLKPSNVLVAVKDGAAIPKVIDFGVAKAVSHALTELTIFTEQGVMIGTPEYMSPEQAEMGALDIDTRTDVYALGVMTYELLTGLLPFDSQALRGKGPHEARRIIREVEPPTPSTRLRQVRAASRRRVPSDAAAPIRPTATTVTAAPPAASVRIAAAGPSEVDCARDRATDVGTLVRALKRELEWIPLRAMHKDRTRRYATPLELADDIRNYLRGRPLRAGPDSDWYRLRKHLPDYYKPVAWTLAGTGAGMMISWAAVGDPKLFSNPERAPVAWALVSLGIVLVFLPVGTSLLQVAVRITTRLSLGAGIALLLILLSIAVQLAGGVLMRLLWPLPPGPRLAQAALGGQVISFASYLVVITVGLKWRLGLPLLSCIKTFFVWLALGTLAGLVAIAVVTCVLLLR